MMDGITVLSQSETIGYIAWFIYAIIGFCIFGWRLLTIKKDNYHTVGTIIITVVVMFVAIFSCAEGIYSMSTKEYTYKVTISDKVNFVEFNNKYEIIDQDGLIYTIKEKESNNESN